MITSFSLEAAEPEVKAPVEVTGEQDSLKLQIVGVGNLFDGVDDAALEESLDRRKPLLPTSIFFPSRKRRQSACRHAPWCQTKACSKLHGHNNRDIR